MKIAPTRIRTLIIVAVIAAATGWALTRIVDSLSGRAINVPWLASTCMWTLAVGLIIWTLLVRPRLPRRDKVSGRLSRPANPLPPLVAARTVALAMAASRVGAIVLGFYIGVVVGDISKFSTEAGHASVVGGSVTAAAALVFTAVALWLERLCRLPNDSDDGPRTRLRT